jgi:hypothetical protein
MNARDPERSEQLFRAIGLQHTFTQEQPPMNLYVYTGASLAEARRLGVSVRQFPCIVEDLVSWDAQCATNVSQDMLAVVCERVGRNGGRVGATKSF